MGVLSKTFFDNIFNGAWVFPSVVSLVFTWCLKTIMIPANPTGPVPELHR